MRLLLIGAPGAGKGTQAERIAEHFGVVHISSGDLLRDHVSRQTAVGRTASAYMDRGELVPMAVVLDMLRKPVVAAAAAGGYVLDGFPRTVEQAEAGYEVARDLGVSVQLAILLDVNRDQLVQRLLARGQSSGRSDDTAEVIERRLAVYQEQTEPLLLLPDPRAPHRRERRPPGGRGHLVGGRPVAAGPPAADGRAVSRRPHHTHQLRVCTTSAKPNSRSSTGAKTSRSPVMAAGSYVTMSRPVRMPLVTSWKNTTIAYAVQNNRLESSRVRSTNRSSATDPATPTRAAWV